MIVIDQRDQSGKCDVKRLKKRVNQKRRREGSEFPGFVDLGWRSEEMPSGRSTVQSGRSVKRVKVLKDYWNRKIAVS